MHQMRSSAVGTGRPSSLSACWMDLVIPTLGSDKVPSRSKQITFMESSPPQSSHGVMSPVFAISRRVRSTSDSGKVAAVQRTDVEGQHWTLLFIVVIEVVSTSTFPAQPARRVVPQTHEQRFPSVTHAKRNHGPTSEAAARPPALHPIPGIFWSGDVISQLLPSAVARS